MLHNYFLRLALLITLFVGQSYALQAQCAAGCSNTTQYGLNEVVICHKGGCGEDGSFSQLAHNIQLAFILSKSNKNQPRARSDSVSR